LTVAACPAAGGFLRFGFIKSVSGLLLRLDTESMPLLVETD